MLTSFDDDQSLFDAVMAGAAGYVLKEIHGTDLVGAVRTVASGQSCSIPRSQQADRPGCETGTTHPLAGLTGQERRSWS